MEDPAERMKAVNEDWTGFATAIALREMPRLDYISEGSTTGCPRRAGVIRQGMLHASTDFPGLSIHYTTDGTEPGPTSARYTGPVEVSGTVYLRSFDTRGRGSRVSVVAGIAAWSGFRFPLRGILKPPLTGTVNPPPAPGTCNWWLRLPSHIRFAATDRARSSVPGGRA
jgi:hypothetical protein